MQSPTKETYLGDGLYASFNGHSIILRATRENEDHWVALEPSTWDSLMMFYRRIMEDLNAVNKQSTE